MLEVKKIDLPIVLIFGIQIKFLDEFIIIILALSPTSTTLLLSALNNFRAKSNNPVIFNSKIYNIAILLKA